MEEDEKPGDYIAKKKIIHDCFFLVGTEEKERISTVKCFLANYSSYFRKMLIETDMKEKNSKEDIPIPDHEPDVFRLMISFVYGRHDIKFEDVDQAMRFYKMADMYVMPELEKISIKYLMKNCKSFKILECAVQLKIKEMEPRAKTFVKRNTKALLSSSDFLNADSAIIEFIMKQEGLNVTEVELWRALVNWAKRQCGNEIEGIDLRKMLDSSIKHIQFLNMTLKEFALEVVPTSILTPTETINVFVDMATKKGNRITEAASKTRHQRSSQLPYTDAVSFYLGGHISSYSQPWECVYEITQINPSQMEISSIELTDSLSRINTTNSTKNTGVHVKLINVNEFRVVGTKSFSATQVPLNISELPEEWVMKASKSYVLCIRYPNNDWSSNIINSKMGNSQYPNVISCKFCRIELFSSTYRSTGSEMASIIKTLQLSVV